MKNKIKKLLILIFLSTNTFIFAQLFEEQITINEKTGFPEIIQKPFPMFNEGLAFAQVTRIEKQKDSSNFVRENYLVGAYFAILSENMKPVNSMIKISAFYPFYHTFNGMRQYPKQIILYAFDIFAGPTLQADMWKYVRFNFSGGLHYMYQLSDEYHLHYLGLGFIAGTEYPLAKHWTLLLDGTFSIDYPNLGTNRIIQPFDLSWQYQINFGVRYSKKNPNKFSYIQ